MGAPAGAGRRRRKAGGGGGGRRTGNPVIDTAAESTCSHVLRLLHMRAGKLQASRRQRRLPSAAHCRLLPALQRPQAAAVHKLQTIRRAEQRAEPSPAALIRPARALATPSPAPCARDSRSAPPRPARAAASSCRKLARQRKHRTALDPAAPGLRHAGNFPFTPGASAPGCTLPAHRARLVMPPPCPLRPAAWETRGYTWPARTAASSSSWRARG